MRQDNLLHDEEPEPESPGARVAAAAGFEDMRQHVAFFVSSTTKSVSPWSVTATSPSLCCSAFPTRLEITCAMRSGSQSPHRSPCASIFTVTSMAVPSNFAVDP